MRTWITLMIVLILSGGLAACKTIEVKPEELEAIQIECEYNEQCVFVETEQLLDEKREDMIYERENRRLMEREEILSLMITCNALRYVLIVKTYGSDKLRNKAKHRRGPPTLDDIPPYAHLVDYACISPHDLRNIMRERTDTTKPTDWMRQFAA